MQNASQSPEPFRAACLTASAAGGVAVIQVVGAGAGSALQALLRGRNTRVDEFIPDTLHLLKIADGGNIIDDVLVTTRRRRDGTLVTDLNLHGGPRIVQRVLMLLQRAGAEIVPGERLTPTAWRAGNRLEQEFLHLLARASTRAVARWIVRGTASWQLELRAAVDSVRQGRLENARKRLESLHDRSERANLLIDGVRVAIVGLPNAGKSTLANALAEYDHAIVSDVPGTTRDWLELPGAIAGAPFVFVDTAGLRETSDALESEAMTRGLDQVAKAEIVLLLQDASRTTEWPAPGPAPDLLAFNKTDLAPAPSSGRLAVSARTGAGLEELRRELLVQAGLVEWEDRILPISTGLREAIRRCLSALEQGLSSEPSEILQELLAEPDELPSAQL